MATYYISATGNDGNDGLSETTPWSSWSGRQLMPGDSVLLKGTETFSGPITFQGNGTPENPIKISSYGVGRAILVTDSVGLILAGGGFEEEKLIIMSRAAPINSYNGDAGIQVNGTADHISLGHTLIENFLNGPGVVVGGTFNRFSVNYCEITNCYQGIFLFGPCDDVKIYGNNIHDNPGKPSPAGDASFGICFQNISHFLIEYNNLRDNGKNAGTLNEGAGGGIGGTGTDGLIQFNTVLRQTTLPIDRDGGGIGVSGSRIIVQKNRVEGCIGTGYLLDCPSDNCHIRYNLGLNNNGNADDNQGGIFVQGDQSGGNNPELTRDNFIYNNTLVCQLGSGIGFWEPMTRNHVFKNIVYGGHYSITDWTGQAPGAGFILSDQLYFNPAGPAKFQIAGVDYHGLAQLQAALPHQEIGSIERDPEFIDMNECKLRSTSPAIRMAGSAWQAPSDFFGIPIRFGGSNIGYSE